MNIMRYLVYAILLIGIFYSIFYYNQKSGEKTIKLNDSLNNNVLFEGVVVRIHKSTNHTLEHVRSSVDEFNKQINGGIYPYRVTGDSAELYCTVSVGRKLGDSIKVVSNDLTIYYNPQKSKEKGSLYVITDPYNIEYVEENTVFK
jgi:hypothetical protein